jgi:hypothetical protein
MTALEYGILFPDNVNALIIAGFIVLKFNSVFYIFLLICFVYSGGSSGWSKMPFSSLVKTFGSLFLNKTLLLFHIYYFFFFN